MVQPDLPRWLPAVGWVMVVVGAVGLVRDMFRLGEAADLVIGIEVVLDVFLVVAGSVIIVVTRRARSG
jgi:hypothetical protein